MTKESLAAELRVRQYNHNPKALVDSLPDDIIISAYITCSCCGEKQVNEKELNQAIKLAKNSEHFLDLCEKFGKLHKN